MQHTRTVILSSLIFSVLAHGGTFYALDRALERSERGWVIEQKKLEKKKSDRLEFEYVEAPPKTHPHRPRATKRISSRDALNQDNARDKSIASDAPHARILDPANQLMQKEGSGQPSEAARGKTYPLSKGLQGESKEAFMIALPSQDTRKIQGSAGSDKITTQEIGRLKSPAAKLYGMTSFEATGSGMGEYMKNLKEKIWLAWFPYLAFQYPQDFKGADAVVSFTLDKGGEVKVVKIMASDGSKLFAAYCVEAVQRASGFGPVPKEILALLGKDEIELKFGFHYR